MPVMNCWEFKQCGREPGGARTDGLGVCPATTESRVDGVNDGKNGGRCCWVIAGTLCEDKVQGSFAGKFNTCKECDFYHIVRKEQGTDFCLSATILVKLKK